MTVGEDSVQYGKRKMHCFLAAAILLFIGKIIITYWPPWAFWRLFFLDLTSGMLNRCSF